MTALAFSTRRYAYLRNEMPFERGEIEVSHFPDGERYQRITGDVAGRDVILVGGTVSDEDTLELYDAYGNLTWQNPMVPAVNGGNVSVTYDGPALQKGMYYQFRATSWRTPGGTPGPISQTEDLRGVFYAQ